MSRNNNNDDPPQPVENSILNTFNAGSGYNDEKFKLIMKLSPEEDLHDAFQTIWATVAIVAALFLSILVGEERFDTETTHPDNMWKQTGIEDVIIQLYHLSIGFCVIICNFGMLFAIVLSVQFAHIPKDHTKTYMRELGHLVNIPSGPYLLILCFLYVISLITKYTLAYSSWVSSFLMVFLLLSGIAFFYGLYFCMDRKMTVLRFIYASEWNNDDNDDRKEGTSTIVNA